MWLSCKSKHEASLLFGYVAAICWCIWLARNKLIFEGSDVRRDNIAYWASSLAADFLFVNSGGAPDSVPSSSSPLPVWSPPLRGLVKVNCDTFIKNGLVAIACVLRDSFGSIIDGFGKRISPGSSVFVVEAFAIRESCVLCFKAGITGICIESDNSSVVSWCIDVDGVPP